MKALRRLCTLPIRGYQRFISPYKPRMCRFSPSCSQYALEAIELHGVLRGSAYGVWRILRCNPLCAGGHDPVPPARKPRSKSGAGPPPAGTLRA